jgi:hypothetical protein
MKRWSVLGAATVGDLVKLALSGRSDSTAQGAMRIEALGFE